MDDKYLVGKRVVQLDKYSRISYYAKRADKNVIGWTFEQADIFYNWKHLYKVSIFESKVLQGLYG